jgi:VWFA-related protein
MRLPILVAIALSGLAQDDAIFKAQSTLATIRFHAIQKDQYLIALKPEDIILLEDGAPRKFTVFENAMSSAATTPVELTLLFDTSGSVMDQRLLDPLVFKQSLLDSLPNVRLAVYGFDQTMTRYCRPTRDYAQLQAAFQALAARGAGEGVELKLPPKRKAEKGGTWLYEAVIAGSREAAQTPGEASRMIMVFSDGLGTTTSRPEDAAELDRELGIPVYPVLLGHRQLLQRPADARAREKPVKSSKKGGASGGPSQSEMKLEARAMQVDPPAIDLNTMRQILWAILADMRAWYTVGFPVEPSETLKKHKLEVRLANKDMGKIEGGTRTLLH